MFIHSPANVTSIAGCFSSPRTLFDTSLNTAEPLSIFNAVLSILHSSFLIPTYSLLAFSLFYLIQNIQMQIIIWGEEMTLKMRKTSKMLMPGLCGHIYALGILADLQCCMNFKPRCSLIFTLRHTFYVLYVSPSLQRTPHTHLHTFRDHTHSKCAPLCCMIDSWTPGTLRWYQRAPVYSQ